MIKIDPNKKLPVTCSDGTPWPHTIFLKNFIQHPHIEIGDGAIIASRSVVTKDVPPYTIVAGNQRTRLFVFIK